jgi:ABC-type uncharacterized transport system permease subunit
MFSRVHIICFAASYLIAWLLELSRALFCSRLRGAVMVAVAVAGWIAHSAFLYYRTLGADGTPLSSYRDWLLLAAWALVVVYFCLMYLKPQTHFGVFLLPLALGLIAAAAFFAEPKPYTHEPASKIWGVIHAVSILLATVAVLVGFAAGLMYLDQARRLRRKPPPRPRLRLPSLEWLQEATSQALAVAAVMLGMGVVSGIILNVINYHRGTPVLPWNDPMVLATVAMFIWLLWHAVLAAVYRPIRQGRKMAYLTIASFLFLVLALAMGLFMRTQHGRSRGKGNEVIVPATSSSPARGEGRQL